MGRENFAALSYEELGSSVAVKLHLFIYFLYSSLFLFYLGSEHRGLSIFLFLLVDGPRPIEDIRQAGRLRQDRQELSSARGVTKRLYRRFGAAELTLPSLLYYTLLLGKRRRGAVFFPFFFFFLTVFLV